MGLEFHRIGIVIGPDLMVDALGSQYSVRIDRISAIDEGPGHYVKYGRILPDSPGPGGVASADGWTFPLRTTQAVLREGDGPGRRWCYTSQTNCHHDYLAADLMSPTGTPVLSPMDGTVIMTKPGLGAGCSGPPGSQAALDNRGDNISIHTTAGDFFMGHILTNSLVSHIHVGDHLKAGEQLGVVGTAGEAQCSASHLHIQLNPAGEAGNQTTSFNIQPVLVKLFTRLPA